MIYAATRNAGPVFGDQPSRARQMYTTVQCSEQHECASFSPVAKHFSPCSRAVAGLVFDERALTVQPLSLGALGVARIIFGGSPAKRTACAPGRVGGHAQFSDAGAGRDPTAATSAMAVANGVIKRKPPRDDKRAPKPGPRYESVLSSVRPAGGVNRAGAHFGPVPGLRRVRG